MCANSDNMQDLGALRETTSAIALAIAKIIDWASSALQMHLGERPTSQITTISNSMLTTSSKESRALVHINRSLLGETLVPNSPSMAVFGMSRSKINIVLACDSCV